MLRPNRCLSERTNSKKQSLVLMTQDVRSLNRTSSSTCRTPCSAHLVKLLRQKGTPQPDGRQQYDLLTPASSEKCLDLPAMQFRNPRNLKCTWAVQSELLQNLLQLANKLFDAQYKFVHKKTLISRVFPKREVSGGSASESNRPIPFAEDSTALKTAEITRSLPLPATVELPKGF